MMYRKTTKQRVALAALLAAAATVITLDFRENPDGPIRKVQEVAVSVVAPLQDGLARIFEPVGDFLTGIGELGRARRDNAELKRRIEALEAQQGRLPEILRENESLRGLVGAEDWAQGESVAARVIGVPPSNLEWAAFIDRGSADGIKQDMAVVSAKGLVGRVALVAENYSKVLLIIDIEHGVGARLTSSGETGVVTGRGDADLRLSLIEADVPVEEGETVVTSGYDRGIYPAGIPIGRVRAVRIAPSGLEKSALVSPFVEFGKLDFVLVLLESGPLVPSG